MNDLEIAAFSPTSRVCDSRFGGKNDQRESTCDHRTARRWHFAGSGAKRPCNWRRTPSSRRRCGQSRCTKRSVCLRGYNEQVGPQEDVETPEEVPIQADVKPECFTEGSRSSRERNGLQGRRCLSCEEDHPKQGLGSPYRSGRSAHWVKVKNPKAPAVKREAEEDCGR
jgi:hypothetical protein